MEWNYNREQEKSKYLGNISVLQTSIFILDKFVDGAQPEISRSPANFENPAIVSVNGHLQFVYPSHGKKYFGFLKLMILYFKWKS